MPVLLQPSALPGGYGAALLQTLVALLAVCVLAWVVLKWGARRGFALGGGSGGRTRQVHVLERIALDPRRSLYLVKVGEKVLLIGSGDAGAPALLTEIDPATLVAAPTEPSTTSRSTFSDVLRRLGGGHE